HACCQEQGTLAVKQGPRLSALAETRFLPASELARQPALHAVLNSFQYCCSLRPPAQVFSLVSAKPRNQPRQAQLQRRLEPRESVTCSIATELLESMTEAAFSSAQFRSSLRTLLPTFLAMQPASAPTRPLQLSTQTTPALTTPRPSATLPVSLVLTLPDRIGSSYRSLAISGPTASASPGSARPALASLRFF